MTTTVVLVDDDPSDLEILKTAFSAQPDDLVIEAHASGQSALEWISSRPGPEQANFLLVTDLNMPLVDGADLIQSVQACCELAPVSIVLSTSARPGDVNRSYAAGANAYHSKPMGYHETSALCRELIAYWTNSAERPTPPSKHT